MEKLLETIKNLPASPGVYQYFDQNGKLLYVGKAKNLKNRVKSYFVFSPILAPDPRLSARVTKMISETRSLEYIVVESEADALILENSLIKQLKPKYNILLRDDKTYPYIYINFTEEFPRFEITRKVISEKNIKYFGPFAGSARDIFNALYSLFPLVQKRGCLREKRVCLFYQIKKCSAPCQGLIKRDEYMTIVNEAAKLINHKEKLAKMLTEKMAFFAENELYEEAAKVRDQIQGVLASAVQSSVDLARSENFDILAIADFENNAVATRMFIREGKVISSGNQSFKFTEGYDEDEAYERAFLSFYPKDMPITATAIYIPKTFAEIDAIKNWLKDRYNRDFEIIIPKIGVKKAIVELAIKNANEVLRNQDKESEIFTAIKSLFNLENEFKRFEVFDNSHFMQDSPVGAMIVYENDRFIKDDYKRYNLTAKNEYDQMKELLIRRVEKFGENSPPDCFVIDGGETLRKLADDIIKSVGANVEIVAISKEKLDAKAHRAKGAARDILHFAGEPYKLETNDKRLQFFQKLRDEAHRFAIEFHRKQKLKSDKKLDILRVKGIGEATLKRLLDVFGSFENINNADFDEIATATNQKIAKLLKP
ncbi:MAG: excinuclease ABC subunit UvrC [Helicobacteraceae bacterium]|nr:excinuclease ABC subunit UvrC [Helicobacteraceae bacterium]